MVKKGKLGSIVPSKKVSDPYDDTNPASTNIFNSPLDTYSLSNRNPISVALAAAARARSELLDNRNNKDKKYGLIWNPN